MDTDYENYSLVYSCDPNDMAYLWILSRTPTLEQPVLDSLRAKAKELLPSYDWNIAIMDKQGGECRYDEVMLV